MAFTRTSFKKGHRSKGGRKLGSKNKTTTEFGALCRSFTFENPRFIASIEKQISDLSIDATILKMIIEHGYGAPKKHMVLTGDSGGPLQFELVEPDFGGAPSPTARS